MSVDLESNNVFIAQYVEDEPEEQSYADFMTARGLKYQYEPRELTMIEQANLERDTTILLSLF